MFEHTLWSTSSLCNVLFFKLLHSKRTGNLRAPSFSWTTRSSTPPSRTSIFSSSLKQQRSSQLDNKTAPRLAMRTTVSTTKSFKGSVGHRPHLLFGKQTTRYWYHCKTNNSTRTSQYTGFHSPSKMHQKVYSLLLLLHLSSLPRNWHLQVHKKSQYCTSRSHKAQVPGSLVPRAISNPKLCSPSTKCTLEVACLRTAKRK